MSASCRTGTGIAAWRLSPIVPSASAGVAVESGPMLERLLERFLFSSRWLLAPFYAGLVLSLVVLLIKALQELAHFVRHAFSAIEADVILGGADAGRSDAH